MKHRRLIFIIFIAVAILQLFVPLKIILKYNDVLKNGKVYKFKTAPIDPNDPFRGKYISLSFDDAVSTYLSNKEWNGNEKIFVLLDEDNRGFAKIKNISTIEPKYTSLYVKAQVYGLMKNKIIRITYPFNKFFISETKAKSTERIYREAIRKSNKKPAYALVAIKNGNGVIKDIIINGKPIKKYNR